MKKSITLIIGLLILSTTAHTSSSGGRESGGRLGGVALFLEFFSPGNGIDHNSLELAIDLTAEDEKRGYINKKTYKFWGREGETTLCIEYNTPYISGELIKALAPSIAAGHSRVNVYAGPSCEEFEKATRQDIDNFTMSSHK